MVKEMTCTICPVGCKITVNGEGYEIRSISGYACNRGIVYGKSEFSHPVRILTTTVKVSNEDRLLPVRSKQPVPRELIFDCMKIIKKISVTSPIKMGDIIVADICDTGIDIIATGNLE
ncbi:MAG: DUF1667 domain-containing protein [Bacillota bacterium]|nr:DUF1667 domain-containing protein [Bacillota bacterium]